MSATPALTDQQRAAVGRRGVSVVLASGAGCGKTHVLTARYLSHLRDDLAEVGQIVAITFTDRAARQRRDRIRSAVVGEMRRASGESAARWRNHLRNLEAAPIGTIHAFCGNLLRSHAVAVGLDPRFEVLDEVLAGNLRSESLRTALHALLTAQAAPADDLRELIVLYGWNTVLRTVDELLDDADPAVSAAWSDRPPEEVAGGWLGRRRAELLPAWVDHLGTAHPPIAGCLDLLRRTPCLGPLTRANVQLLLDECPKLAAAPDLAAAVGRL